MIDPNNCHELVEHHTLPTGDIDPERDTVTRYPSFDEAVAAGQHVLRERPGALLQIAHVENGLGEPVLAPWE